MQVDFIVCKPYFNKAVKTHRHTHAGKTKQTPPQTNRVIETEQKQIGKQKIFSFPSEPQPTKPSPQK